MFTQVVKENRQRGSAYLIVHHTVETCGGVEVQLSTFFSSALDGDECSASRLGQSNPGGRTACSHWVRYMETGPTILLDSFENRKIACPYRESNNDSSVIHPVLYSVYRFLPAALEQVVYIVTVVI